MDRGARAGRLRAECFIVLPPDLMRAGLSDAERARSVARRKEIYEALHPETMSVNERGGPGRGNNHRQLGDGFPERFTASTAKATGRSERAVQRDAERGEKISERALALISGMALDRGTYLDRLKRVPRDAEPVQAEVGCERHGRGERISDSESMELRT